MSLKESQNFYEKTNPDDLEDEDLVDAEELTNKKKLRERVNNEPGSGLSQPEDEEASVSQESTNQLESNTHLSTSRIKSSQNEIEKKFLNDKKRNENLKSNNSKNESVNSDQSHHEFTNIKSIKSHKNNQLFYLISAERFSQFESLLFDLIGFTSQAYKLDENEIKKHSNFDLDQNFDSKLIPDLDLLNNKIDLNSINQLEFKNESFHATKFENDNESVENEQDTNYLFKSKLITVVLNEPIRPRKAGRILLNKKNTSNLDTLLNEISNFFKTENIKKLFYLNSNQVQDIKEILNQEETVFIALAFDKIHNKDFELEPEEIKLIYANQFMTNDSSLSPTKIKQRMQARSIEGSNRKKSIQAEKIIENSQMYLGDMPEDLLDNYEIGKKIGDGYYSIVRECKDINTGIKFALKTIDLKKCGGKINMIENEIKILKRIKHQNIVKLVEEYKSKRYYYLIFEYYKAGDLLESIKKRKKFLEKDALPMIYSLASALTYLHSINIVHRDVKLDNILVQEYSDGSKSLKLGDFGLAIQTEEFLTQKCGSPIYVAPEVLLGKEYKFEVDIWSLGVIAYILLCGYAPYQGDNEEETLNLIKTGELKFKESDWENVSKEAIDLITKMLDRNQETRIKASDILEHDWFKPKEERKEKGEEETKQEEKEELDEQVTEEEKINNKPTNSANRASKNKISLNQNKKPKTYKPTNVLSSVKSFSNQKK